VGNPALFSALDQARQQRFDSYFGDKNLFLASSSGKKQCN
jgi:hypothetical protein